MRGLSQTTAVALLTLIAVVSAGILYMWYSGFTGGNEPSASSGLAALRIVAVSPLYSGNSEYCYGVSVAVANIGDAPVTLGNVSSIILGDASGSTVPCIGLWDGDTTIPPGEIVELTALPMGQLSSARTMQVRVVSTGGAEASSTLRTMCERVARGYVVRLPALDGYTTTIDAGGVNVTLAVELYDATYNTYNVSYRVDMPDGVRLAYARLEILNSTGGHPRWAANPVVEHYDVPGPNYAANYWLPVGRDEFPVTVLASLYTERG
ncbi:hypothetical protein [Pyrodictium abyssi]|uniref:DUF11 domain-containing protein n=1 Tax=Pyrodictium abyssi TaxID=54256 RepID=A0ABN6ZNN3_9CREN|nr:hypothetical protein PABY_14240 [Pyrodictium abyssi]